MGWSMPFTPFWLCLLALALSAAVLTQLVSLRGAVHHKTQRRIFLLRGLAVLALLLFLLKPYWLDRQPDPNRFRIRLLADVSGSMQTRDLPDNASRAEALRNALDAANPGSWLSRMQQQYRFDLSCFADREYPFVPSAPETAGLGNATAIGDALNAALSDRTEPPGAIVLFTDGKNNRGPGPLEFAGQFKARKIPVNVIGAGAPDSRNEDAGVRFTAQKWETEQDQEFFLEAVAFNRMPRNYPAKVRLLAGGQLLEEQAVELPANGQAALRFKVPSERQGLAFYRVEIGAPEGDVNPANDQDGAAVRVKPPKILRVLYISNRMRLQYRFLKMALANQEPFELSSIVKLGDKRFYTQGKELPEGFPEKADFWFGYHAILLDTQALDELTSPVIDGLKNFVDRRGGGLLALGDPQRAARRLGRVLPVAEAQLETPREDRALALDAGTVFPEDSTEWKIYLPAGYPYFAPKTFNRAARELARGMANAEPALLIQAYGAGRSACWATEFDWVWPLNSAAGLEQHKLFWSALVEWLGAGSAERILQNEPEIAQAENELVELKIDLLGADFEPSRDAAVEAVIYPPRGERQSVQLFPDHQEPGRYAAEFSATVPGQYAVTYRAKFPGGETLEQDSAFATGQSNAEQRDVQFEEEQLINLARLTGGSYRRIGELDSAGPLKLSPNIPLTEEKKYPADNPLFLFFALGLFGTEWIVRRQAGLK